MAGYCDPKFAAVEEAFEKLFEEHGDVGASFAATIEGEYVIDLWGGHKDLERTQPWQEDTLCNVYSTTKTMTFLTSLVLADRGLLDLQAPVAEYWPEFATRGKENVKFSHFLCHAAGVPGLSRVFSAEELYDWDKVVTDLAEQEPWWEPGTQSGYHALTQGHLIGEVVRRITGKTIGTWFREEIAEPLGADFFIGVPDAEHHRISDLHADPTQAGLLPEGADPESIPVKVFASTDLPPGSVNTKGWRKAEIPAGNGHGNARSVVRAQTPMALGGSAFGVDLLSKAGVDRAKEVQIEGLDLVLGFPLRFGMGYSFGNEILPFCSNPNAIWWAGAGGSTVVIDEDHKLCYSYVMNQMRAAMVGDMRSASVAAPLRDAL